MLVKALPEQSASGFLFARESLGQTVIVSRGPADHENSLFHHRLQATEGHRKDHLGENAKVRTRCGHCQQRSALPIGACSKQFFR
jgi:hypothetical protein